MPVYVLEFFVSFRYKNYSGYAENNKDADQTALMRRLISDFVVRIEIKPVSPGEAHIIT